MNKKKFQSFNLQEKSVLVRVDFNVPIKEGQVTDDTRIVSSLPTIQYLLDKRAKIILCSHLGRPKGTIVQKYSLEPVAKKLEFLLKRPVRFVKDCIGESVKKAVNECPSSEILLLENLRFHPEEEKNNESFAKELGSLAQFFAQDAFGAVHRAHASTVGVTKFLPSGSGFLLQNEILALQKLLQNPEHPFLTILGGAKVSDKINVIQNLLPKSESIVIGGGMSYTFLKAQGFQIGNSLLEEEKINFVKSLNGSKSKIALPLDHLVTEKIDSGSKANITQDQNIAQGWIGVDIGPKTILQIEKLISQAKTIFWNGPLGVFEIPEFSSGTVACAKMIAQATKKGAFSVVGGGDSIAALNFSGCAKDISHISTGGGASLEFLEGKALPGIEALQNE
ncbi:MAG: phosphoglycerate kinase [Elusimicrobia bacterium RIFCSPLOWO2_02_FULL_39_32]|nr:MAG: phosphoglycerate kinase [Elusimicrobia bacterium GWA2_38_7]OGR79828.1 MAG: phosphoglycerate kinase [Elusimicrobia bacterium RIFCSPHIGHO2_02_FULL_39_36]OGR93079.1 MAG: phosphoglycerate kinase [Elusimicrobia bacterium RIFCSPLOWO2_02_FULL_39_32]OGS00362.1 MAG: phosphoglycerate kinase [Elusimicrobia bacterium RIFCSPLOWO2_12_FULL_39_28]